MGGHDGGLRLLACLASTTLLAGCGAGASSSPVPATPTPIVTPSAAVATPMPTPTPLTYGSVTVVTGRATCPGMEFVFSTDPYDTRHIRDDYVANRCTVTTDDPRVSGSRSSTANMDLWKWLGVNHELVEWGTQRLENERGAWEGRFTGTASFKGGDFIANWYRGTGGYAGLAYFELLTGFDPWKIQGQIFPGDPPPPFAEEATGSERPETGGPVAEDAVTVTYGTATCPTADFGTPTTDADGVQHYRGSLWKCTVTANDPRVSGTETAPRNEDLWGTFDKGAAVEWGTSRLENAEGAWEGAGSGVWSSDRGYILAYWYKGTGGYAGLSYFELWTGGEEPWIRQGQIFPGDPPTP